MYVCNEYLDGTVSLQLGRNYSPERYRVDKRIGERLCQISPW